MRLLLIELHNEASEFLQKLLIDENYSLLRENGKAFVNVLKNELELVFFLFFFYNGLDLIDIVLVKNEEPGRIYHNADDKRYECALDV